MILGIGTDIADVADYNFSSLYRRTVKAYVCQRRIQAAYRKLLPAALSDMFYRGRAKVVIVMMVYLRGVLE